MTCYSFLQNIYNQAIDDGQTNPTQLPYFEGDFWPNIIEESIREIEQEEEERIKEEEMQNAAIEAAENTEESTETGSDSVSSFSVSQGSQFLKVLKVLKVSLKLLYPEVLLQYL